METLSRRQGLGFSYAGAGGGGKTDVSLACLAPAPVNLVRTLPWPTAFASKLRVLHRALLQTPSNCAGLRLGSALSVRLPGAGHACAIDAHTTPVDSVLPTQPCEHGFMQPGPFTVVLPFPQSSPAGHAAAEAHLVRQFLPRYACEQHEQNAIRRSHSTRHGLMVGRVSG